MKKIISLMLAVTMICASIGLTAFAATTTTVEAEADGVSAYTLPSSDKSNSKILKNTVSSKESVTYYIQANDTPRATMFKLAQVIPATRLMSILILHILILQQWNWNIVFLFLIAK